MSNPGDRQAAENKARKDATGSSPNGVANAILAGMRGSDVAVKHNGQVVASGKLVAFDAYSMVIETEGIPHLVFKGPGVVVAPIT